MDRSSFLQVVEPGEESLSSGIQASHEHNIDLTPVLSGISGVVADRVRPIWQKQVEEMQISNQALQAPSHLLT